MSTVTVSTFLLIYVFGGITLIPLILGLVLLHFYYFAPVLDDSSCKASNPAADQDTSANNGKAEEIDKLPADLPEDLRRQLELGRRRKEEEGKVASGYFVVYRDWPGPMGWKEGQRPGQAQTGPSEEEVSSGVGEKGDAQDGQSKKAGWQVVYKTLFDRKKNSSQASLDSTASVKGEGVYGGGAALGRSRTFGGKGAKGEGKGYFLVLRYVVVLLPVASKSKRTDELSFQQTRTSHPIRFFGTTRSPTSDFASQL
jgi:hypothetical protein